MTKISSNPVFFKWVFPLLFVAFALFVAVLGSRQEEALGKSGAGFALGAIFMLAIGFGLWLQFASDLVSEVWLDEDSLVIRGRGREVRTKLANVVNVNDLTRSSWPRVTLLLREPCELGREIAFSPRDGKFGGRSKVVMDLIMRIDKARLQDKSKPDSAEIDQVI